MNRSYDYFYLMLNIRIKTLSFWYVFLNLTILVNLINSNGISDYYLLDHSITVFRVFDC